MPGFRVLMLCPPFSKGEVAPERFPRNCFPIVCNSSCHHEFLSKFSRIPQDILMRFRANPFGEKDKLLFFACYFNQRHGTGLQVESIMKESEGRLKPGVLKFVPPCPGGAGRFGRGPRVAPYQDQPRGQSSNTHLSASVHPGSDILARYKNLSGS